MDFKAIGDRARGMVESAATSATTTACKMLDEFNEALPTMRALGFVVKDVHVGMGLLPEVGAKLVATTDSIDEKKLQELIEKHAEKKLLVTALKGLLPAPGSAERAFILPIVRAVQVGIRHGAARQARPDGAGIVQADACFASRARISACVRRCACPDRPRTQTILLSNSTASTGTS